MSNGLKSRVKRLENAGTVKEIDGIIIYFDNPISGEVDGIQQMVDADYFLDQHGAEPITEYKIDNPNKPYITYMPIEDKAEEIEFIIINN